MKISFLGTGLMGRPMASRLLLLGHDVIAYNRTKEKALPLETLGGKVATSSLEAISSSPLVILMLADAQACEAVLLPFEGKMDFSGRTIIQMGTISPQQSIALSLKIKERGGDYLEAPVLGSIAEAEKGELVVLVGSAPEEYARFLPVLKCFSPEPVYVGPVGQAAAFKLALNQLIASLTACFAYSLGMVRRRGIDLDLFMRVLRQTSLYAFHFDKKLPRMANEDFANPTFPLRLLHKDVGLMLDEGQELGLDTQALAGVFRVIQKGMAAGWGEKDYTSISALIISGKMAGN